MDQKELNEILDLHSKWLRNEDRGRKADLYGADLSGTNLSGANLRWANLSGAKDGNNELLKCNTVLGLKWSILMFQDVVTVGCEKHKLDEWRNFTEDEIGEMHRGALDFYPILMAILEYEYRNTKWSKQEK